MRGSFALAAAAMGYASFTRSLAETLRRIDPARAHALAPGDAQIAGVLAQRRLGDSGGGAFTSEIKPLAQAALRADPTVVSAVVTMGLLRQKANDAVGARRLLAYAQRLSRRDLQTQLWAIEDAVIRGDVAGALRHYDIALRTSRDAPELLFPVLSGAIAQPDVCAELVKTLKARPLWTASFIGYVAGSDADPQVVAQLFMELRRVGLSISTDADAAVINRLVAGGAIDAAWRYYATLNRGADRNGSRDPRFLAKLGVPTMFDWTIPVEVVPLVTLGATDGMGFAFALPPGRGGILVRQMQWLPAGRYRLEGSSSNIEQPASSLPYWILTCRDGMELGRVIVAAGAVGRFTGQFDVPAGCPTQTLAMVARPSESVGGVYGQIDRVALKPAR